MSLSLTALYELVFPCHCEACGGLPESGQYRFLCGSCAGRMIWVGEEYCRSCGYPYAGGVGAARRCVKCDELQPVFSAGRSLLLHQGPGGALVRALKYRRALHLREDLARIVRHVSGLADYVASSVLVPVPLYGLRQRERGFNQAQVLAEVIAGSFAGLTVEELLVRVRATSTQTRLTREDRQANVKKSFCHEGQCSRRKVS
ncbi:MAG: double zinc ribbon domain-containing protein [Verrucomicrobia bacterium]|nr:double zinc ribbon domain-containing protein [Verrucomicrobiota bacterium]